MFQMQSDEFSPICPICREPVRLENAKTDQDGHAIHEDCYCASLNGTSPITGNQSY